VHGLAGRLVGYSKWRAALGEPEKPLIWHTDVLFACADGRQEPLINMLWGLGIGLTPVIAEHAAYLAKACWFKARHLALCILRCLPTRHLDLPVLK
jgi:hypothetical protein